MTYQTCGRSWAKGTNRPRMEALLLGSALSRRKSSDGLKTAGISRVTKQVVKACNQAEQKETTDLN